MRTSVSGHSVTMEQAENLYPKFINRLVNDDGSENTLLRELLVEMGLRVELNGTVYEKDCGPYSKVEVPEPEDWTDEDEELSYFKR